MTDIVHNGRHPAPLPSLSTHPVLAIGMLLATFLAAGVFFQEGVMSLLVAWQLPEYSHGPLIPVLSGLLFLRQMRTLPANGGPVTDRWPGVWVAMGALAVGALGKIAGIADIVAYAMILFVGGIILVGFGWRRGRHFWPAVVHLAFMLPLPGILYWKVSTTLQLISSELGVWLIQLAGVSVFLDGNIIDLGIYKLHVAEACSGLRYLYPILSFSYIFATLYRGPTWHKLLLLVSAAPITVIMNSVRIGIIGVIVDSYGLAHVEGITHLLEGWVIFLASVVLLFGLVKVLMLFNKQRMSLGESLDLDFADVGAQLSRARVAQPSVALGAALMVTVGAVGAWAMAPERVQTVIERAPLIEFPSRLGDWRLSATQTLTPDIEVALGADDYFSGTYVHAGTAAPVDVFVAWYADQTKGGIHSPEVCLPGGGWEMAEIAKTDLTGIDGETYPVNRAIIQKGQDRLLVYYWFEQYGGRTASDYVAKAALVRDSLLLGRSDGALVRMFTPIMSSETIAQSEARLRETFDATVPQLSAFVPRRDQG